jgi:hypothetical protein
VVLVEVPEGRQIRPRRGERVGELGELAVFIESRTVIKIPKAVPGRKPDHDQEAQNERSVGGSAD